MNKLIYKELKIAASPLTYFFVAFAAMTLIPGYPILVGAFFICFGIFQSFQSAREANDILYSVLLPIKKSDVVKAKYLFTAWFQLIGFALMIGLTILRMTVLADAAPYKTNVMMSANLVFLGFVLLIFAAFNWFFLSGFFKTAYYYGKPFITFIIMAFLLVGIGETLHHIPGLEFLNSVAGADLLFQFILLCVAALLYILITVYSYRKSKKRFEKIDL